MLGLKDASFEELRFSKTQRDAGKFLPENLSPLLPLVGRQGEIRIADLLALNFVREKT
jgi:hypothetical protein